MRPYLKPLTVLICAIILFSFAANGIPSSFLEQTNQLVKEDLLAQYEHDVDSSFSKMMDDYQSELEQYKMDSMQYTNDTNAYNAYMEEYNQSLAAYDEEYAVSKSDYEAQLAAYNKSVKQHDEAYDAAYRKQEDAILKEGIQFTLSRTSSMNYNNHVGNDWGYSFSVNGKNVSSGDTVTLSLGSTVKIKSVSTEYDSIPDVGSNSGSYKPTREDFKNGFVLEHDVTVRENRGRYSGNTAGFTFTYEFTPKPYTVIVDESSLPAILSNPVAPAYAPPEVAMVAPIIPVEPVMPRMEDVDVPYPDLNNISIAPFAVYNYISTARIMLVIAFLVFAIVTVLCVRKIKKIHDCIIAERKAQQIEQYRVEFYRPEEYPDLKYNINLAQHWTCEEEKRINLRFMLFLTQRNQLALAQHHLDFLKQKKCSPYLEYDAGLLGQLDALIAKAEEQVKYLTYIINSRSNPLLHLIAHQEYQKLYQACPYKKSPFSFSSSIEELNDFFNNTNVTYLEFDQSCFIFTPFYILKYLQDKLQFTLISYRQVSVTVKDNVRFSYKRPTSGEIVSTSWMHTKKDGSPDRRYSDNPIMYHIYDGIVTYHIGQDAVSYQSSRKEVGYTWVTMANSFQKSVCRAEDQILSSPCLDTAPSIQQIQYPFLEDDHTQPFLAIT